VAINGSPPRALPSYLPNGGAWWSPAFADALEHVEALVWPESIQVYGKMRHDPSLAQIIGAITLPIRQAPWFVDPSGCEDRVVELVADDLGLQILGRDENPGPARRRAVIWKKHMRLALQSLVFGHMPFAERYEIRDGQARLVELSERMPSTITEIRTTEQGDLEGIVQFGSQDAIPANHLTWYCHEREGAMWQGRSILRPAYAAWLLKHEAWRVHAISIGRFGMGVPQVTAPQGATPQQIAQAEQLATQARAGDQSGAGLPYGFNFELKGLTGTVPDPVRWIEYLDSQMADMVLAQGLKLGSREVGSRSLGETFINLFLLSLRDLADEVAETATSLSVRMTDYNFGEQEPAPKIVCGDVGSRPEVTAEALASLLQSGALQPDAEMEAWIRERWTLPKREPRTFTAPMDLEKQKMAIAEKAAEQRAQPAPTPPAAAPAPATPSGGSDAVAR
jgi:hypothetical protein